MRISDILASHAHPGTVVFDQISPSAGVELSPASWLPPEFGLVYTREPVPSSSPVPRLVLHDLPVGGEQGAAPAADIELGEPVAGVVHVIFFDRVERLLERALLSRAGEAGWELVGTHVTQNRIFRFAAVFAAPAPDTAERTRVRMVNEYRYYKLLARIREEQLARNEERVERAEARSRRAEKDAESARAEIETTRTAVERMGQELDRARATIGQMRQRLVAVETQLKHARTRLVVTRRSVSFRIGRATTVALRGARKGSLLAFPVRWLATFRGPDEQLADLDRI